MTYDPSGYGCDLGTLESIAREGLVAAIITAGSGPFAPAIIALDQAMKAQKCKEYREALERYQGPVRWDPDTQEFAPMETMTDAEARAFLEQRGFGHLMPQPAPVAAGFIPAHGLQPFAELGGAGAPAATLNPAVVVGGLVLGGVTVAGLAGLIYFATRRR